jgi:hypothetical protein
MGRIIGCVIIALFFVSCKTMETYVEDLDAYYVPVKIDISNVTLFVFEKNLKKKTLAMNEYYLIEDSQISDFSNVPPKGRSGTYHSSVGGKYSFFKGDVCLGQFEIVTESVITVFSGGFSIGSSQKYIRLKDERGIIKREIKPEERNSDIYINLYDEKIGNVGIEKYESRSANQAPDSPWKYYTGFMIKIDGREYGILAFYQKPHFYRKIEFPGDMDEEARDKITLYMFMAYESFNRNDTVFARE